MLQSSVTWRAPDENVLKDGGVHLDISSPISQDFGSSSQRGSEQRQVRQP